MARPAGRDEAAGAAVAADEGAGGVGFAGRWPRGAGTTRRPALGGAARPGGFDPPHRFVDVLSSGGPASWPARVIGWWRHTHEFSETPTGTRVYDHVDTTVPAAALRSTFVYRHRQLADDLAAHRDAAAVGAKPLVVAVSGASGLVGSALTAFLSTGGHRVIRLVRRPAHGESERQWEPARPAPDLLSGVDAVVHLAGTSIAGRFTDAHRRAIRDSRIEPTHGLAEAAARADDGPRTFVSASAIGIYGSDRGDALLCEESVRGDGFLADVVADWEAATSPASEAGLRVVTVRTGIVQSARGGTLRLMRPLFAAGLGRSARQRPAVAVLDRPGRPARRLLPRAVRHPLDRSRQRRRTGTAAQRRLHQVAGRGTAPASGAARTVAGASAVARGGRAPRSSPRPISGSCRPSSKPLATGSGIRASMTRWLTNSGTPDEPRA